MTWRTSPNGLQRRARSAFGDWLSVPAWDWFTTHTFRADHVSPRQADYDWYAWFNTVRMVSRVRYGTGAPFYFRVAEYQSRGALHYHALIGGVGGDVRRLLFKDLWELFGYARVEKYEAGKGANFYVGKYLTKTDGDIRFSHNLTKHLNSDILTMKKN